MSLSRLGFSAVLQGRFVSLREELGVERAGAVEPARVVLAWRGGGGEQAQEVMVMGDGDDGVAVRARFSRGGRRGHEEDDGRGVGASAVSLVVGDWVAFDRAAGLVRAVVPRSTLFERKRAGRTSQTQALAANAERALLVMGLVGDVSVRRLERYLALVHAAGAEPVICLTKAALVADPEGMAAKIAAGLGASAERVPVLLLDLPSGRGREELAAHLGEGTTAVLLGSSGAGKSTLVNHLAHRALASTQEVRAHDATGRHTTTHRELFVLQGDPHGVLIDTPGLREVGLSAPTESVEAVFAEVVAEASRCRFRDCAHAGEPGCAVRRAIDQGELDADRLESFRRLSDEAEGQTSRERARARRQEEKAVGRERAVALRRWKKGWLGRCAGLFPAGGSVPAGGHGSAHFGGDLRCVHMQGPQTPALRPRLFYGECCRRRDGCPLRRRPLTRLPRGASGDLRHTRPSLQRHPLPTDDRWAAWGGMGRSIDERCQSSA